jgi:hypothetical protein
LNNWIQAIKAKRKKPTHVLQNQLQHTMQYLLRHGLYNVTRVTTRTHLTVIDLLLNSPGVLVSQAFNQLFDKTTCTDDNAVTMLWERAFDNATEANKDKLGLTSDDFRISASQELVMHPEINPRFSQYLPHRNDPK